MGPALSQVDKGRQLGPFPVHLEGPVGRLNIRVDPVLVGELLNTARGRRPQRAFRNFLREDLLFAAASRS